MSIIGIDLDGTLATYKSWSAPDVIDDPDPKFVKVIRQLYMGGHDLYIWSCRADHVVDDWLVRHNLRNYFEGINRSPGTSDSIKASFDYYIGDEALNWNGKNAEELIHTILNDKPPERYTLARDRDFMSHQPVPFLAGTGRGYLDMFEPHWRRLWTLRESGKRTAFMTICSHAKPYSKSFIHATIRRELYQAGMLDKVDYIHISNAGIIPSGDEMTYPFNAYDHDGSQMSEDIQTYFSVVLEKRMAYWAAHYANYDRIIVYLRNGKTWRSTEAGLRELKPLMIEAIVTPELEYAALPDPDDCLADQYNLTNLINAMRENII